MQTILQAWSSLCNTDMSPYSAILCASEEDLNAVTGFLRTILHNLQSPHFTSFWHAIFVLLINWPLIHLFYSQHFHFCVAYTVAHCSLTTQCGLHHQSPQAKLFFCSPTYHLSAIEKHRHDSPTTCWVKLANRWPTALQQMFGQKALQHTDTHARTRFKRAGRTHSFSTQHRALHQALFNDTHTWSVTAGNNSYVRHRERLRQIFYFLLV